MRTEIAPRAKKKSRLDRIAHYNMHMVLKIKEEDRGSYVCEARKAYRKCRNKKPTSKSFNAVIPHRARAMAQSRHSAH